MTTPTTEYRYEVSTEIEGVLCHTSKLSDAIDRATRLSSGGRGEVEVFDRMARRGGPQKWSVGPDGNAVIKQTKGK